MKLQLIAVAIALTLAACGKKESPTPPEISSTHTSAVATPATSAQTTPAEVETSSTPIAETSLVSIASGAWITKAPLEYDSSWSALLLLDENSQSGWATPKGALGPHEMVLTLPERTLLKSVEFDTGHIDGDTNGERGAKQLRVEVSDESANAGFQTIADITLVPRADKQRFAVSREHPGRWVKLTIKNNFGSTEYVELMDFRAYGEQLTQTPVADASGTYDTNYGRFHLQQRGSTFTGCYEWNNGLIQGGGLDGRVARFNWVEVGSSTTKRGPAVIVISPDGKEMLGLWWHEGETNVAGGRWSGKKNSNVVGSCPHWKSEGGTASELAKELASDLTSNGRTRLYGINFDVDSATIRDDSKPTLDSIVQLAKEKADWKFGVEGHTDSSATAAHNQTLSEQRANSVKAYLVSAGVSADRLSAQGFGATKPVADNGSAMGRAQNRRVELTKN
jgi:outer membrane protein OmpA-like peptidoglycan-associated protein